MAFDTKVLSDAFDALYKRAEGEVLQWMAVGCRCGLGTQRATQTGFFVHLAGIDQNTSAQDLEQLKAELQKEIDKAKAG